jgi:lipopolysaccharide/colanic/teichoic acid biosynthesis glycosyltransferase
MYLFLKRIIDIIIATVALILLSPLLLPSIIILALTGEREVFYFQKRVGYKNQIFDIWKFATMVKDSPNIGTGAMTLRNDPRVTPFGKILRMTKVNELPQIFNVLRGEMSIVGPRPLMPVSVELYPDEVKKVIYNSKPGITGIGSLVFRDEEKLVSDAADPKEMYRQIFPYKGALELWYQKNASIMTDLKLIFLTAWNIVFSKSELYKKWFPDLPERPF